MLAQEWFYGFMTHPGMSIKVKSQLEVPPKMKIANNTTKVDKEVLNVRRNVEFNAASVTSRSSRFG